MDTVRTHGCPGAVHRRPHGHGGGRRPLRDCWPRSPGCWPSTASTCVGHAWPARTGWPSRSSRSSRRGAGGRRRPGWPTTWPPSWPAPCPSKTSWPSGPAPTGSERRAHHAQLVSTQVTVDNNASATATVVEVRAEDVVGQLHRITQALVDCRPRRDVGQGLHLRLRRGGRLLRAGPRRREGDRLPSSSRRSETTIETPGGRARRRLSEPPPVGPRRPDEGWRPGSRRRLVDFLLRRDMPGAHSQTGRSRARKQPPAGQRGWLLAITLTLRGRGGRGRRRGRRSRRTTAGPPPHRPRRRRPRGRSSPPPGRSALGGARSPPPTGATQVAERRHHLRAVLRARSAPTRPPPRSAPPWPAPGSW